MVKLLKFCIAMAMLISFLLTSVEIHSAANINCIRCLWWLVKAELCKILVGRSPAFNCHLEIAAVFNQSLEVAVSRPLHAFTRGAYKI